jgi:rubrerythrin
MTGDRLDMEAWAVACFSSQENRPAGNGAPGPERASVAEPAVVMWCCSCGALVTGRQDDGCPLCGKARP